MVGTSPGSYIKTFKYFEDFKDNAAKNNKFLGYLRLLEYSGDLTTIGTTYLVPPVKNPAVCPVSRRKLRLPALSIENERKMLAKLKEVAGRCLAKFSESYTEDLKLLQNKALTYNERNCIVYRSEEKKVRNSCDLA
ncbi:MAG: SETD3 family histone-lysine N-methyltransferase [Acidobacteriaceae bacterium]|nr:SETD3 family histone-lysine N-methyltransferase [Acidobacteriaceae bacterium]